MSDILIYKIKRKIKYIIGFYLFQKARILKYKLLSGIYSFEGNPKLNQPALFQGKGSIVFNENVILGVYASPYFFSSYCYIEARNEGCRIVIGKNTMLNNNCSIICENGEISIGENCLIGSNVEIINSDFHNLDPDRRFDETFSSKPVIIEENVFIGSNVKILKGVKIGKNSVIGNSSIVTKPVPENSIAVGNPAKVIKSLSNAGV